MNEQDEIEALLPWFAAGALDPEDERRVQDALARRPELRRSLASIEEDRGETIALNESLGAPSPEAWTRIMQVVQSEPRRAPLSRRIATWFGWSAGSERGWLAGAAIAVAIVMVLEAGVIELLLPKSGGPAAPQGFATASAGHPTQGADILVSFAPDARLADVSALLRQHDATIVDGPRQGGFYHLKVGASPLGANETTALVHSFAEAPIVKMALPGGAQ